MYAFPFPQQTQWAPNEPMRAPVARGEKEWTLSNGKCVMDVALDKETYHHGEEIPVNIAISNTSPKQVAKIKVYFSFWPKLSYDIGVMNLSRG